MTQPSQWLISWGSLTLDTNLPNRNTKLFCGDHSESDPIGLCGLLVCFNGYGVSLLFSALTMSFLEDNTSTEPVAEKL